MRRAPRSRVRGGVAALALVGLALAACSPGDSSTRPPAASPTPTVRATGDRHLLYDGAPIFAAGSFWTTRVTDAPTNPESRQIVAALADQVAEHNGGIASFNVWKYNASIVEVAPGQPRVDVAFDDCQHKGYTPRGLTGRDGQFSDVPLPADATPNPGNDAALAVVSPATHELWEFWRLKQVDGQWQACWGGHIADTRTNPGYFEDGFGASASGLAGTAGAVHIQDVRAGRIDHALTLAIPGTAGWKEVSWPAQRSDGSSSSTSPIKMGTRLRLPASVDVDALGLSRIGTLVAHAAQDYGLVVSEKAGTVSIGAESGALEERVTGTNPWNGFLDGQPSYSVLKGFPWKDLVALPFDYGKPAAD